MSDHSERSCTYCGSLLHHEDDCPQRLANKATPCRICGCLNGEPSLCHACIHPSRTCYRITAPDLCSSCFEWIEEPGAVHYGDPLIEAARAELRARRAEWGANFRGNAVPGAKQLRYHAARMRVKARRWRREAALVISL